MRFPSAELSGSALRSLLERMGPDAASAGVALAALRQRLHDFFDRRGVPDPAVLADETLDRVARKIEAGEPVANVAAYGYGVARRVLFEWHHERAREAAALRGAAALHAAGTAQGPSSSEARVACLERCLMELPEESRDFIVAYYQAQRARRADPRKPPAETNSVKAGALRTRAYRLRGQLWECLRRCLAESGDE